MSISTINGNSTSNDIHTKIYSMQNRQLSQPFSYTIPNTIYHNIIYVYSGEGFFSMNNRRIYVPEHSFVYFPPSCKKEISTNQKASLSYYSVEFSSVIVINKNNSAESCLLSDMHYNFPFVKTIKNDRVQKEFIKAFSKLYRSYQINVSSKESIYDESAHLRDLIGTINDSLTSYYFPLSKSKIIEPVLSYISAHYAENITLDTLANIADVSISYLNTLFKHYTNSTPIDFLISTRISKARELLELGFSINEVAEKTGFSDVSHFSKLFKEREKLSPSNYRKRSHFSNTIE